MAMVEWKSPGAECSRSKAQAEAAAETERNVRCASTVRRDRGQVLSRPEGPAAPRLLPKAAHANYGGRGRRLPRGPIDPAVSVVVCPDA